MEQYRITGMSCAACATRIEKAVLNVKGVTSCSVNLLTNSMGVEGKASPETIVLAVQNAGYDATLKRKEPSSSFNQPFEDHEMPILKKRFFSSLVFLVILMYVSMGHMMWGWPLPTFFHENPIAMGLLQLLLTIVIMVINQKFFIHGFKSLWHRAPNMDTLVSLGATAAFGYSTFSLFAMCDAQVKGNMEAVMMYMHEFYFESAAMILTLITLGKMLEARAKGKTTNALKSLMKLAPKTATIEREKKEMIVPIEQVVKGDVFLVRPGENIPVDGIVLEGNSAVDESTLTGESIPVDKEIGNMVFSGTLNQSGFMRCEATNVKEDTTLAKIIQMVYDASATKAPIAKAVDKVSKIFVPTVLLIALITILAWLIAGQAIGFALSRGIAVCVISCPCALGLATPVAIMVGNGIGAKNGILFKTAVSLEKTGKAQIVVLDKTGTITKGKPKVTTILPVIGKSKTDLLSLAYALEKKSEHPLAKAIITKANEEELTIDEVEEFKILPGNGLVGSLHGAKLLGGSYRFICEQIQVPENIKEKADRLSTNGETPLFFAKNDELYGIIAVADELKEDSCQAIKEMKDLKIHVVMLTGDNARTAKAIGERTDVDEIVAGVLPDGKEKTIRELKKKGTVIMVGDGVNDAVALASADIGMAIKTGSDVAIDAADVVLMKNSLRDVNVAIRLSRATLKNIHENLFWAFLYNLIGIPLAAGVFIPLFNWQLNPMFAAAAMSLSSVCVVVNALRLNFFKTYDRKEKLKNKLNDTNEEEKKMKKILKIEGMMCSHCEMHVKKALEALEGVSKVEVHHQTKSAIVTLEKDVPNDVLKQAVVNQGYQVIDIQS